MTRGQPDIESAKKAAPVMKVFVLQNYDGIIGVYSTRELADEAARRLGETSDVPTEYAVNPEMPPLIDGCHAWCVHIRLHDNKPVAWFHVDIREYPGSPTWWLVGNRHDRELCFGVQCLAKSKEEAIEIARALKVVNAEALQERIDADRKAREEQAKHTSCFPVTREMIFSDGLAGGNS